jgi:hypothetical protein
MIGGCTAGATLVAVSSNVLVFVVANRLEEKKCRSWVTLCYTCFLTAIEPVSSR